MPKYRDYNHGDVFHASFTDALQEFVGILASRMEIKLVANNQLQVVAGAGNSQISCGIGGLWRYNSASVTATHPTGNAGITHDVFVVASANVFSAPDADTTDYAFGVQILPTGTTPTGNFNARPITQYRKIGETDWDGTNITGVRRLVGQSDNIQTVHAIASWPTIPAGVFRAAASSTVDTLRVEQSDGSSRFAITKDGEVLGRRAAATDLVQRARVIGETTDRFQQQADGKMLWAGNGLAPDTDLFRSAADTLKTDDTFDAAALKIAGTALASTHLSDTAALARLAGPTFTGVPSGPTAAVDTSSTQFATTAFVLNQAGGSAPVMDGSATVGTSARYSRQDHVHPTDTSRAPLAGPTFTGTVTIPTAAITTLNVSGVSTLDGNVSLGNAAADLVGFHGATGQAQSTGWGTPNTNYGSFKTAMSTGGTLEDVKKYVATLAQTLKDKGLLAA